MVIGQFPQVQLRRLRAKATLRSLIRSTQLSVSKLVAPVFVKDGIIEPQAIISMPGHYQWSLSQLPEYIDLLTALGIKSILLFGIPATKDEQATSAYTTDGIVPRSIAIIKQHNPDLLVITDLCFCSYTSHGHCGIVEKRGKDFTLVNDKTLAILAKQAVTYAQAGADVVAPSCMMDGMIQAIRHGLDHAGLSNTPILSYAVKYASAFYGPFRDAAEGAPSFGDRHTYQLDYANAYEAIRECALDIQEGCDMLMVKPAHTYLDIIQRVKENYPSIPLGAYHTSGEYALLQAAAQQGLVNERAAVLEVLTAIARAGADFIITYYAAEVSKWLS